MQFCLGFILLAFVLATSLCLSEFEGRKTGNCYVNTNCHTCLKSTSSCDWCVLNHKCTNNTAKDCRLNFFVRGINDWRSNKGSHYCPSIYSVNHKTELLVPFGTTRSIQVKAPKKLPYIREEFICQFIFGDQVNSVKAKVIGGVLNCNAYLFDYKSTEPIITLSFDVIWKHGYMLGGGETILDNPDNIEILVYKCSSLAEDCDGCLAIDKKFDCGWCNETNHCEIKERCNQGSQPTCPNPIISTTFSTSKLRTVHETATSSYLVVDPMILSVHPSSGPLEGGTILTVYGKDLDVGNDLEIYVGSIQCEIVKQTMNKLECKTGRSSQAGEWPIILKFGGTNERISEHTFMYLDSPSIEFENDSPIKAVTNGGLIVSAKMKNFGAIQEASMFVIFEKKTYKSPCNITDDKVMQCRTPKIYDGLEVLESISVPYGFLVDNVTFYFDENHKKPFILSSNPELDKFQDGARLLEKDYLTLNGRYLDLVFTQDDFKVTIGDGECKVIALQTDNLTCIPPKAQPFDILPDGSKSSFPPLVQVQIGLDLDSVFIIGRLEYKNPKMDGTFGATSTEFLIFIVTIIVLVIVIVFLYKAYKMKSEISERAVERMKKRVDLLELQLAVRLSPDVVRSHANSEFYEEFRRENPYESIYEPIYLTPIVNREISGESGERSTMILNQDSTLESEA